MSQLHRKTAAFMAAVLFQMPALVYAQAEVVELEVPSSRMGEDGVAAEGDYTSGNGARYSARMGKPDPASMTEFYFQLQTLQQEVQQLRGIVEEQSYQLKKLKQQRLDDYLDLDRRVSQLSKGGAVSTAGSAARPASATTPVAAGTVGSVAPAAAQVAADAPDELETYRAGINAVLKQRDYEQGIDHFNTYLTHFPNGLYAPNAKYWLGQVYMQKEDLVNSHKWFDDLVSNHPNHQKTPEAQFKLGKVLHLQGDTAAARAQLESVASSGSSAAKLAQDYLNKNF